jgi:UPF0755 protein
VISLAIVVAIGAFFIYREFISPNVKIPGDRQPYYIYIPTGSDFEDVVELLKTQEVLIRPHTFTWAARQMKYDKRVRPGRYLIHPDMSNKELINMLKAGKQSPVKVIFNNIRTKKELAERISTQIEVPADSLLDMMNDTAYAKEFGFTTENFLSMFIPDTYEIWWTTTADLFFRRMKHEYDKYWTEERIRKAEKIGFTPVEASVLASIVQKETNYDDEKPILAGVYITRFRKGMHLQADPTLIYAIGDFSISRVLNAYKTIDSPYNTYKFAGLPPGPICLPSRSSIDAVLNFAQHGYLYFCAKDDFSGYHAYAVTYQQHLVNARKFQRELNRRGIMK